MRRITVGLASVALISIGARTLLSQAPPLPAADLVLTNGVVITVDAKDSIAEAVAVTGGKIVFVGSSADAKKRVGPNTQVIDLHGRTATPGLIDTHVHFSEPADNLDLGDAKNMNDVITKVREWAAKLQPGQWVRGGGWDEGKLAERRYITAADLDKAAPNNPVYLTHTTGHYGVANTLAMKLSNVTKDTPDPPGGTIDRDKDGNPTGVMKERATGLIRAGAGAPQPGGAAGAGAAGASAVAGASGTNAAPARGAAAAAGGGGGGGRGGNMRADVLRIIDGFNREGMTGAKDLNISQAKWDLYKQFLDEGKLTVHMFALWPGGATLDSARRAMASYNAQLKPPASLGNGRLFSGGVKLYIDGSGGARTAWMYDDWNKNLMEKDTGNKGYPANNVDYPEIYKQQVMMLTEASIHIGTHAVGDKGIDWVVDAYAEALKAHPTQGLRHSIIHANVPTDHAIKTMAMLEKTYDAGYPEAQATFLWWIGDTYAGNFGPARNMRLEPFKSYVTNGIIWGGGSDYNVTPYAARYGLWASVARKTETAAYGLTPFGLAESVDIHIALKSYTIWAAHQLYLEKQVGSLEIGKDADIAVWDKNMYTIPTDEIRNLQCQMTLLAGRVVYEKK